MWYALVAQAQGTMAKWLTLISVISSDCIVPQINFLSDLPLLAEKFVALPELKIMNSISNTYHRRAF